MIGIWPHRGCAPQLGILARLKRKSPTTIRELAAELAMDRTTLGRNILPLERDGLIAINPGKTDRRLKELSLTAAGEARLGETRAARAEAHRRSGVAETP